MHRPKLSMGCPKPLAERDARSTCGRRQHAHERAVSALHPRGAAQFRHATSFHWRAGGKSRKRHASAEAINEIPEAARRARCTQPTPGKMKGLCFQLGCEVRLARAAQFRHATSFRWRAEGIRRKRHASAEAILMGCLISFEHFYVCKASNGQREAVVCSFI